LAPECIRSVQMVQWLEYGRVVVATGGSIHLGIRTIHTELAMLSEESFTDA